MDKKMYLRDAASELSLSKYQLRRLAKEHKIPFLQSGNRYIFPIDLCKEYLKNEALKNVEPVANQDSKQYGSLRKINI